MRQVYTLLVRGPGPVPLGAVRHCFRRRAKAHANAKPTLLRAFDPVLLGGGAAGVPGSRAAEGRPGGAPSQPVGGQLGSGLGQSQPVGGRRHKGRVPAATSSKRVTPAPAPALAPAWGQAPAPAPAPAPGTGAGAGRRGAGGCTWQLAELEVLRCRALGAGALVDEVRYPNSHVGAAGQHQQHQPGTGSDAAAGADLGVSGDSGGGAGWWEVEVSLVTGRTHQVRLRGMGECTGHK